MAVAKHLATDKPIVSTMAKKALVFGLGLLGGGVATANWLLKHGYEVTITDLKDEKQLTSSLKKIKGKPKLVLGRHREEDIRRADIIVVNPDVSPLNYFIQLARKLDKEIENEATLFYHSWDKKIIGVTGTRGKTTTVSWISHLLSPSFCSIVGGNSISQPLMKMAEQSERYDYAITELPSFLLEFFGASSRNPDIAVITNVYQDHLNRHGSLRNYALAKANIFKHQTPDQQLILNADNIWTGFILRRKPASRLWFFSLSPLKNRLDGVFYAAGKVFFQEKGVSHPVMTVKNFVAHWGEHNMQNLLAASLSAHLAGCSWAEMEKRVTSLPEIEFREQVIFENPHLTVINDTTASSPDGGVAALKRFGGPYCILITGGTDRCLDFNRWAEIASRYINLENAVFLEGSATDKMFEALGGRIKKEQIFGSLKECVKAALAKAKRFNKALVLFSPASKSFEKFKNEYDRGNQFNSLIKNKLKKRG